MKSTPTSQLALFSTTALLGICALTSSACHVPASTVQVSRIDENDTSDLSGHWNARDSKLVSDDILRQLLPWAHNQFVQQNKRPVIILQRLRNKTTEHIDTQALLLQLQQGMLASGTVTFVADRRERKELESERRYQDMNASEETRKEKGNEIGADFALGGEITSVMDRRGGTTETSFRVNLHLLDLSTNQKVWVGQSAISKRVQRAKSTW